MEKSAVLSPIDGDNLLSEMGLDRQGLIEAIRFGASEHALCTSNDGIGFAPYLAYDKIGRRLRELYLPRGWERDNSNNQCAIKNPRTRVRVVPCNFDEDAGNPAGEPSNRSPKGEVSRKSTDSNKMAWLPGLPRPKPLPDAGGYLTWVLGAFIDSEKPIGAELSFPTEFDGQRFTLLSKRIPLMFGDGLGAEPDKKPEVDDTFGEVEIDVKRK